MDRDPAIDDLGELVQLGLARGARLLSAGERAIAARILDLTAERTASGGEAASLFARLSGRKRRCFHLPSLEVAHVPDVAAAAEALCRRGLADRLVPWTVRAEHVPKVVLAEVCRRNGLAVGGRKPELVARVRGLTGWIDGGWLRVLHQALIARLERFALLRAHADRSTLVVARIGVVRWPAYRPTAGSGLFRDRRALRAWEGLLVGEVGADRALEALRDGRGRGPAGLDLEPGLARIVRHAADAAVRSEPARAEAWYRELAERGWARRGKIAVRWARAAELSGRRADALAILAGARADALPSEHEAIGRAGRRLGRVGGVGIPPEAPLSRPIRREVRLAPAAGDGSRPLWSSSSGPVTIEAAVASALADLGRRAIHAEGAPFATLCALLCAELWFLPVRGALPVPFLAGPLDLGTPAFRAARAAEVDVLLGQIAQGLGPERVRAADPVWRGVRLAGARWESADPDTLVALAEGLGPGGLQALVEAVIARGPRAMVGMPDLAVLPGPAVRIAGAHPARLGEGFVLVEVKGPTDAPRDEQRVWHDRLSRAGAPIELWEVSPPPGSGRTGAALR